MRSIQELKISIEKELPELIKRWQENPEEFCEDVLRVQLLPWQVKVMRAVAKAKMGVPNSEDGKCKRRFAPCRPCGD